MDWYALFVKTGKEDCVKEWIRLFLHKRDVTTVIPQRRLAERKGGEVKHVCRTLFPGYVFICTTMSSEIYYDLKKIPDLIRILNTGENCTRIDNEEMFYILRLLNEEGIVDFSKVLLYNSKVVVKAGPLKGIEGLISAVDTRKKRVTISLNFMGIPRKLDIGIEILPLHMQECLLQDNS